MSTVTSRASVPKSDACRARCATFALQISFLLGRQATLGQEPPIQRRSTTAVRRPERARLQARSLPAAPLPRIRISYRSRSGIADLLADPGVERYVDAIRRDVEEETRL